MSVALLDVNVLISLMDPAHPAHDDAHSWFSIQKKRGWATCPLTLNGCVRIVSNSAYPTIEATPAQVIDHLARFCSGASHHFWEDSLAITDPDIVVPQLIGGHARVTDAYLLALAVRNRGKLATFDRAISVKAVIGATSEHIEILGQSGRT